MNVYLRTALFALAVLAIVGLWALVSLFIQMRTRIWELPAPCLEYVEEDDPYNYALCAYLPGYILYEIY